MSTLSRGDDSCTAQMLEHTDVPSGDSGEDGLYVTNEAFLYRVVGMAPSETGEVIELEDCYFLDVARVPIEHFRARRLRVVTAAPDRQD